MAPAGDESFKFLTYQLLTVGYWPTVAMTGNGELGFDSELNTFRNVSWSA